MGERATSLVPSTPDRNAVGKATDTDVGNLYRFVKGQRGIRRKQGLGEPIGPPKQTWLSVIGATRLATLELSPMGKRRGRPKTSERDDATARIDRLLLSRAKTIAGFRGLPVAELLGDLLREPLDREFAKMTRELEKGGT
jgi:hypothetical protein